MGHCKKFHGTVVSFGFIPFRVPYLQCILDGFGKLAPSPLVGDADTNAWLTEGELYIRALAKRNILRDVIRDYGEARVLEAISEDYKSQLIQATTLKSSTGTLRSTQF
jgi:hypothetical protein